MCSRPQAYLKRSSKAFLALEGLDGCVEDLVSRSTVVRGDYDIQTFDDATAEKYGLRDLRLGDIVAITDADHSYGRIYRTGALAVGVVVHGRSYVAGHGPGVTSLLSSGEGKIEPVLDPQANLADILQLR